MKKKKIYLVLGVSIAASAISLLAYAAFPKRTLDQVLTRVATVAQIVNLADPSLDSEQRRNCVCQDGSNLDTLVGHIVAYEIDFTPPIPGSSMKKAIRAYCSVEWYDPIGRTLTGTSTCYTWIRLN